MLHRIVPFVAALALAACAPGDNANENPPAEASATLSPDEQAWEGIRASYVQDFNQGQAAEVAALYAEDAWRLPAAGQLQEGRAEIQTDLATAVSSSPTLDITGVDNMIMGDVGVGIGTYQVSVTPEGEAPVSYGGSYLNLMRKVDGEWKIAGSITNYDAERPEGWSWNTAETEIPADEGTMGDVVDAFVTNWNAGQPEMVADAYAEDVVMSFSNSGWLRGRAAVASDLAARIPEASTLTVHDVATIPLAEGWALDGGWYQIDGTDGAALQVGSYVHLMQQQDDGSWLIHWGLTNAQPPQG